MDIIDIVKFNDKIAVVVDEIPEITYEKFGTYLIGSDERKLLFDCLYLHYDRYQKAFAGREFDLRMKDGTVTHCDGQYWSGRTKECAKEIGIELGTIIIQTLDELKKCYVFTSYQVNKAVYRRMVSEFFEKNPEYEIFGYWEYDNRINGRNHRRGSDHPNDDFQRKWRDHYTSRSSL